MKCEKCGKEISNLLVDVFRYDGSDGFDEHPIFECEKDAAYIETSKSWTGYDLSEEEMLDTIVCPHCKQFPFKNAEIQVYDVVRVVCFKEAKPLWPGCDFCKKELNDYPFITAIGEYGDSINSYIPQYCPLCGRPLTPEAWEETRKRMDVLKRE